MHSKSEKHTLADGIGKACHVAAAPGAPQSASWIEASLHSLQFTGLRERHLHKVIGRTIRAYYTILVDDQVVHRSDVVAENATDPCWDYGQKPQTFPVTPSSTLTIRACRDGHRVGTTCLGEFSAPLLTFIEASKKPLKLSSEDSPHSTLTVDLSVETVSDPLSCRLEHAANRIAQVERRNDTVSLMDAAMKGMSALSVLVHGLSAVHPTAKAGYVFLSSACMSLSEYDIIDEDIQDLLEMMKDTLHEATQCKSPHATDRSQACLHEVARLITHGAALIDEWHHTHSLKRPQKAAAFDERLLQCKEQLEKVRGRFRLELLVDVRDSVRSVGNDIVDLRSGLAEVQDAINQLAECVLEMGAKPPVIHFVTPPEYYADPAPVVVAV